MTEIDTQTRPTWTTGRLALAFGFLTGAGGTVGIYTLRQYSPFIGGARLHDIVRWVQDLISIPGLILAAMLGLSNRYVEGFDWAAFAFITSTNGLLLSIVAYVAAVSWARRHSIFTKEPMASSQTQSMRWKSALVRKFCRAAVVGFGAGAFLTLFYLSVFLISEGDSAIAWVVIVMAPIVVAPADGLAHIFAFNLQQTFDERPIVAWSYLVAVNGALCATIAISISLMRRLVQHRTESHENANDSH